MVACLIVHCDHQLNLFDQAARSSLFVFNYQPFQVVNADATIFISVNDFEEIFKRPGFSDSNFSQALSEVLMCLLEVEVSSKQSLEDLLCFPGHSVCDWASAGQEVRKDSTVRHDNATELTVVDAQVVILVVPHEDQVSLVFIVEGVADVAEEAFAELSLRHGLEASVIEQLVCAHASEVDPVG